MTDEVWVERVKREHPALIIPRKGEGDKDARACIINTEASIVPRLLLNEFVLRLAGRLLQFKDLAQTLLTPPVAQVHTAYTSAENPPKFWLVHITACFPCPGTPVTRCVRAVALLDASHVELSRVIDIRDAGVIPTDNAANDGLVPFNALPSETIIME